jgi:multidrug efflux system membrane fusion protein
MKLVQCPRAADLCIAAALSLLSACASDAAKKSGPPPAVPVKAADATRRDVPVTLRAIGSVAADNTVKVRPRVGGELTRVAFREGEEVREGQLLFAIDPRPFEAARATALADSARDAARSAGADAEEQRYAELVAKDFVTRQAYDDVRANAAALRASLQADAAACRNARLNLSFCSIRAAIAGRTGDLLVEQGNLVAANDANPLVVIRQIVPVRVGFSVPERHLPEIRRNAAAGVLRVQATVRDHATQVSEGELTFIDNAVDESTGTIRLKATFPNTDQALWPGQFVDVALILAVRRDAVVIPIRAVQQGQQGDFVYVIGDDSSVALRPVRLGEVIGDEVVAEQGLDGTERVVTDGQLRLSSGARVEIRSEGPPEQATPR